MRHDNAHQKKTKTIQEEKIHAKTETQVIKIQTKLIHPKTQTHSKQTKRKNNRKKRKSMKSN